MQKSEPTEQQIAEILATMREGVGYHRAVRIAGIPQSAGERWLARGKRAMAGAEEEQRGAYAWLAREVERERAVQDAACEKVVRGALDSEDERIKVDTAKWLAERRMPGEYAPVSKTIAQTRVAEELLDALREHMDDDAYRQMVEGLAKLGVDAGDGE